MTDVPHISIHDLPDDERPRERLLMRGASALSAAELLAIILRTGNAQENALRLADRILAKFDGLHGLAGASTADLEQIKGLGAAKITQILAALELGRRLASRVSSERPIVQTAADAARLMFDMADLPQEHVRVILLDNGRRVLATPTVYIGTVNASVLRVSEVFREAITRNAAALVIVHNHPSGDPSPSPEDMEITRTLVAAGHLLDIYVLDHVIIGHGAWTSLRDLNIGFS